MTIKKSQERTKTDANGSKPKPFAALQKEASIILEAVKPSHFSKALKTRQAFSEVIIFHLDIPVQSGVFYCCEEIDSLLWGNWGLDVSGNRTISRAMLTVQTFGVLKPVLPKVIPP